MTNKKNVVNITETDLFVRGIGLVKAGEEVTVPADFNNANFKEVKTKKDKKNN